MDHSTCEEAEKVSPFAKMMNKTNKNIIRCASTTQFNHKMIKCKRVLYQIKYMN